MPEKTLLKIKGVSKIFRMGEVDVPALRDATMEIYDGEFLIVVGPSGSGKTTLLNIIGGMDQPTEGSVHFKDTEISNATQRDLTLYRRHQIGFIFQFFNLIPTLTALENVQVASEIVADPADALETLGLVGLKERADHFPSQLSGGEQQRVAIARALAKNPTLLLCDEPTGSLDLETGKEILALLKDLTKELQKTVVLITHNNVITTIGDRIAKLLDGRVDSVRENSPPGKVEDLQW